MSSSNLRLADPRVTFLSVRHTVRAYVENDFFGEIIWGASGSGKTRYTIKALAQVYGEWEDARDANGNKFTYVPLYGMKWDAWKEWMQHDLGDYIGMIERAQNKGRQVLMGALDDAGRVASNQKWQSKFGQAINDYANVQRRDFACLNVTTPHPGWILGHIRNMPGGHTSRINKVSGNKYQRQLRYARFYEGWLSPDLKKSGVRALWDDWFDIWLPEKVEKEWEPVNRKYSQLAVEEAKKVYEKMKEKGKEHEAERYREDMKHTAGIEFRADEDKDDGLPSPNNAISKPPDTPPGAAPQLASNSD